MMISYHLIELFSKSILQSHQEVLQRGVLHPGKTICSRVLLIFFLLIEFLFLLLTLEFY